ncbi:MAG: peptidylprolyl isomerase [Acidobacteriota bacterium]|nr:peptidylprolyl isomerase [Acidobacteriota bacterium]
MNVCHKCGTTLIEGQRICPACGADNSETARPKEASPQEAAAKTQAATATEARKSPHGPKGFLNATTKALIVAAVAILLALGIVFWQVKASRAMAVTLSADDMSTLVESFPPQIRMQLASSPDARKEFAKNVQEILAIAEEARAAGFADRPEMKRQLDLAHSVIIGQKYIEEQSKKSPGAPASAAVSPAEIDAFLKEPGQEQKFEDFVKDAKARNPQSPDLPDAQKQQLKQQWAQLMVAERKGRQEGLDKDRAVQLQMMFQDARVLAIQYANEQLKDRLKATDSEIDAYIAKHPELDPSKARAQAEDILKRARAGEDFAKLAREYSSDPGSKDKGGDLGWFGRGQMVKPFEDEAFSLQPGQISDHIVESDFGFHIIKVEERGTKPGPDGKPEEQVHARHILISSGSKQSNPFAPPQSPKEQAREAVEQEKQKKVIDEIVQRQRNHIHVAEDFQVTTDSAGAAGTAPGGNIVNITDSNYDDEVLKSKTPVLLYFSASWATADQQYAAPVVESLTKEYAGRVKVGRVDFDTNSKLVKQFNVPSVPTFIVIKNGTEQERKIGANSDTKEALTRMLNKYTANP